jgi:hypothetical protein
MLVESWHVTSVTRSSMFVAGSMPRSVTAEQQPES